MHETRGLSDEELGVQTTDAVVAVREQRSLEKVPFGTISALPTNGHENGHTNGNGHAAEPGVGVQVPLTGNEVAPSASTVLPESVAKDIESYHGQRTEDLAMQLQSAKLREYAEMNVSNL